MIPNSSLEKTYASKDYNNLIWFDDLIDLLICLADHGSCESNEPLDDLIHVTQEGWQSQGTKNYTKHWFIYDWMNWSNDFYDFYDFVIFNGFELTICVSLNWIY